MACSRALPPEILSLRPGKRTQNALPNSFSLGQRSGVGLAPGPMQHPTRPGVGYLCSARSLSGCFARRTLRSLQQSRSASSAAACVTLAFTCFHQTLQLSTAGMVGGAVSAGDSNSLTQPRSMQTRCPLLRLARSHTPRPAPRSIRSCCSSPARTKPPNPKRSCETHLDVGVDLRERRLPPPMSRRVTPAAASPRHQRSSSPRKDRGRIASPRPQEFVLFKSRSQQGPPNFKIRISKDGPPAGLLHAHAGSLGPTTLLCPPTQQLRMHPGS